MGIDPNFPVFIQTMLRWMQMSRDLRIKEEGVAQTRSEVYELEEKLWPLVEEMANAWHHNLVAESADKGRSKVRSADNDLLSDVSQQNGEQAPVG
jgi:hypothetical protein